MKFATNWLIALAYYLSQYWREIVDAILFYTACGLAGYGFIDFIAKAVR